MPDKRQSLWEKFQSWKKRRTSASVAVYYHAEKGYIITSHARVKDAAFYKAMPPVGTLESNVSAEELGKVILAGLKRSKNAKPVDSGAFPDYKFWQISGIKGFSAFSKKYRNVDVALCGKSFKAVRLKRVSDGGYVWAKDENGREVSVTVSGKDIGKAVLSLLQLELPDDFRETPGKEELASFQTVHGSAVTYKRPSDAYTDAGDGHTDAYQVYAYEEDQESCIAFLIDSGYAQISSRGVRERWEQQYGSLKSYRYREPENGIWKAIVSAVTEKVFLKSYFCQDGEDHLELMAQIGSELSAREKEQFRREFKRVADSVEITE